MSSSIRRLQKQKSNRKRTRLNSRGKQPGPAQTPASGRYRGYHAPKLRWLTDKHDLAKVDKDCRECHGTGVVQSAYVDKGKSKPLACACVPMKVTDD
jgi:hypothetical protein